MTASRREGKGARAGGCPHLGHHSTARGQWGAEGGSQASLGGGAQPADPRPCGSLSPVGSAYSYSVLAAQALLLVSVFNYTSSGTLSAHTLPCGLRLGVTETQQQMVQPVAPSQVTKTKTGHDREVRTVINKYMSLDELS